MQLNRRSTTFMKLSQMKLMFLLLGKKFPATSFRQDRGRSSVIGLLILRTLVENVMRGCVAQR